MTLATPISEANAPVALVKFRSLLEPLRGSQAVDSASLTTLEPPRRRRPVAHRLFVALLFLSCGHCLRAQQTNWAAQARQEFEQKQGEYKAKPEDPKAAWQFGRSCFDLADFAGNKSERATLAQQGIDACRKALSLDSNAAPAHYYLALNQGQLARTKTLGALRLVSQMERELFNAIALDEHFDHAGPDRTLGLLYRDAPSFGSIGSRSKARQHLERAVKLSPDYPDNRLSLLESYLKWGERENALRQMKILKEDWPRLRTQWSGRNWEASWMDWEERLAKAQKRLEDTVNAAN
jgi:tetratricopeptide (TPR) repeat protein